MRALHQSLKDAGLAVSELEERFYGMLEFEMTDPDGHMLSFGQDLE